MNCMKFLARKKKLPLWKTNNIKFIGIIIKISFISIHLYLSILTDDKEMSSWILFKSHMRNNRLFRLIDRRMDYFKSFLLPGTNSLMHKVIYLFFSLKVVPWEAYIQDLMNSHFSISYTVVKSIWHCCSQLSLVWNYSFLLDPSIVFSFVGHKGDIKSFTCIWFAARLWELHLLTVSKPLLYISSTTAQFKRRV